LDVQEGIHDVRQGIFDVHWGSHEALWAPGVSALSSLLHYWPRICEHLPSAFVHGVRDFHCVHTEVPLVLEKDRSELLVHAPPHSMIPLGLGQALDRPLKLARHREIVAQGTASR